MKVPEAAFTCEMSDALTLPSALKSQRNLLASTGSPESAFVWLTSELFTSLFPVESPTSTFMLTAALGSVWPGLGLAISSALAGHLGGELKEESDGLSQGSTFTIIFPSTDAIPERKDRDLQPGRSLAGLRILLVEDHDDSAVALTQLLAKQGYVVRVANTVAAALEAVAEGTFDLLICDIGLPDGTGYQFIEAVRERATTPAIALSGFGMEEDISQSKSSGFDVHLTKPVNFTNLEAAIRKLTVREATPENEIDGQ